MSLVVDEHRQYLADPHRVSAYQRALTSIVRPGDVGVDLASGTGILGMLACRAGASRIYAIESEEIAALAIDLAAENGLADRITVIQDLAARVELPERVDFIVTDLAGRFGFEAGLIEVLGDARRRFLKPGGTIIPNAVTLFVAPVSLPEVRAHVDFWSTPSHGLTFAAADRIAKNTGYPRPYEVQDLLGEPATLVTVDLRTDIEVMIGEVECIIDRDGRLDGVGGWFTADLAPGVELTNDPRRRDRIARRNVFFPTTSPIAVRKGDVAAIRMSIRPANLIVQWRVEVRRGSEIVHCTASSTFNGFLLGQRDLAKSLPTFKPSLTEAGKARRTVVTLCDGSHSIREIERQVFERHPGLFRTASDAAAFVAEVVTRYAV